MILLRKHILSKFSKTYDYQRVNNNYYDEVTQVSYNDKIVTSDIANKEWTGLTETIENSDADEFNFRGWSEETRMLENSDADEFVC